MADWSPEARKIPPAQKRRCRWPGMSASWTQVVRTWLRQRRQRGCPLHSLIRESFACFGPKKALTQKTPYHPPSCFKVKKILEENVNASPSFSKSMAWSLFLNCLGGKSFKLVKGHFVTPHPLSRYCSIRSLWFHYFDVR